MRAPAYALRGVVHTAELGLSTVALSYAMITPHVLLTQYTSLAFGSFTVLSLADTCVVLQYPPHSWLWAKHAASHGGAWSHNQSVNGRMCCPSISSFTACHVGVAKHAMSMAMSMATAMTYALVWMCTVAPTQHTCVHMHHSFYTHGEKSSQRTPCPQIKALIKARMVV